MLNLNELHKAVADCLVIPNSMLPKRLQDQVRGGRTVSRLHKILDSETKQVSKFRKLKNIKAKNIELLAAQVSADGELNADFDYSGNKIDELQLYKNQIAMVSGMVSGGQIEKSDLESDDEEIE